MIFCGMSSERGSDPIFLNKNQILKIISRGKLIVENNLT